jgi:O-antigen/teichoic acid export membrane protein
MPTAPKATILRQTLLTFCGQSSGLVVAIFSGIVVARSLGPAGKGVLALAMLALAVFSTYGDGIQSAIMYQCGRNREPEQLVYGACLRIVGAVFIPLAAVLFALGLFFPRYSFLAFVGCAIPFTVYGQVANGFFLLKNRIATTIVQGAFGTFGYALIVVPALLIWHVGINGVLAIWAATTMLAGIYAFVCLSAALPVSAVRRTTREVVREQFRFSLKSGGIAVAGFLNLRVDVWVVGLMLDARLLGIYSLAVATAELMWQVSRPLIWTTFGRIAAAERSHSIALTAAVTRNVLAVETVVGVILFAIAPVLITRVYGSAYADSANVVRWLIPGVIFYAATSTMGYYLSVKEGMPMAMFWMLTSSVIICALITATTLPVLGLYGAALATSVTYVLSAIVKGVLFMRTTGSSLRSFTLISAEDFERYQRALSNLRLRGARVIRQRPAA